MAFTLTLFSFSLSLFLSLPVQLVSEELDAIFENAQRAKSKEDAAVQHITETRKCSLILLENASPPAGSDAANEKADRTLAKDLTLKVVDGIQGSLARRLKAILHFIQFKRLFLHLILAIVLWSVSCFFSYFVERPSHAPWGRLLFTA